MATLMIRAPKTGSSHKNVALVVTLVLALTAIMLLLWAFRFPPFESASTLEVPVALVIGLGTAFSCMALVAGVSLREASKWETIVSSELEASGFEVPSGSAVSAALHMDTGNMTHYETGDIHLIERATGEEHLFHIRVRSGELWFDRIADH